jgi:hypothetical protein
VTVQEIFIADGTDLTRAEKAGQVDIADHFLNEANITIWVIIEMGAPPVA